MSMGETEVKFSSKENQVMVVNRAENKRNKICRLGDTELSYTD